jgi:phosphatidate cytidylyltransferase
LSEFLKRIVFGLIAAPAFLLVVWLGGWYFVATIMVIVWLMQWELSNIFKVMGAEVSLPWSLVMGMVIVTQPFNPLFVPSLLVMLFVLVLRGSLRSSDERMNRIVSSIFIGSYIPLMMSTMLMLRNSGTDSQGYFLLLMVILMVWGNDSFAYFGGKLFGKHPLAPKISPKKTWEGFISGFFGAALGYLLAMWLTPGGKELDLSLVWPLIILVSIFGPIGDLAESRIKRKANLKDSGSLLPGHGGVLDRFDAMMLSAPVAWVWIEILIYFQLIQF